MDTETLQQKLFAEIKRKAVNTSSVVDEIAGLLQISTGSAYRRLRGEKVISIDELYKLCTYYKISLDGLLNI